MACRAAPPRPAPFSRPGAPERCAPPRPLADRRLPYYETMWALVKKKGLKHAPGKPLFHTLIHATVSYPCLAPLFIPALYTRVSSSRPAPCGWFTRVFHCFIPLYHIVIHTLVSYLVSYPLRGGTCGTKVFDTHRCIRASTIGRDPHATNSTTDSSTTPSLDTLRPQKHATPENNIWL
jgi:hypothetical protein